MNAAKLASLSKEEKLRLYDLLQEKKRRARESRAVYAPNTGQLPVHLSKKILRAVFSGNGAGKTAMAVNEAKWAVEGVNPITGANTAVPCRVYVVLDKPDKVEQTWLPEIKKWLNLKPEQLHKKGKPYISSISFDNGSFINFLFHDQEPMSFESIEGDVFIFDEPPPRHVYVALRRGGRTKGRQARYLIIGTPLAAPWLRTDIYEPWVKGETTDTECFRFGTTVNQANLAENYIEQFSSVLSEKEKRIRLEGEFFDLEGLALSHLFRRETHVVAMEWNPDWPCVVAIDPHPTKKHVAVLLGASPTGLVYLKEFTAKLTARPFARALKDFYKGYRLLDIVCDSLGAAEMTGGEGFKSFIGILQEEGVRVRSTTYDDKNDEDWIQRIQECLVIPEEADGFGHRTPKLRILSGNVGVIGDIETVQWVKYRNVDEFKPKLDIGHKDYLACLKYALATNLNHTKKKGTAYYHAKPVYGTDIRPRVDAPKVGSAKLGLKGKPGKRYY
jgi:hypothetical protein